MQKNTFSQVMRKKDDPSKQMTLKDAPSPPAPRPAPREPGAGQRGTRERARRCKVRANPEKGRRRETAETFPEDELYYSRELSDYEDDNNRPVMRVMVEPIPFMGPISYKKSITCEEPIPSKGPIPYKTSITCEEATLFTESTPLYNSSAPTSLSC
ncbi:uncharacterized protein LOC113653928 isoform X1 [Tachysurus ichikawai]